MNVLLKLSLAALLAGVALATACSSEKKPAVATAETVRDVAVVPVQPATVPDRFEAVGTVHASEMAQLAAQIMGNVVSVNVHEGDRVRRGQVLVVLDESQPRAGLERATAAVQAADHESVAAEADYTLAAATMKRYQELFEKKSVSPQEFDEVKARFQAASARRDGAHAAQAEAKAAQAQARTVLEYTRIRAPFDGVVTEKRVDPGALAAPGMPLLTVEGAGRFRLEATVDESNLRAVHEGGAVPVRIDALGDNQWQAKVVQIVPAADPGSRSFVVKLELPANPSLRSGLFGRAYFSRGERQSLLVPQAAVVNRGQLQAVYVLGQDKVADLRYITLGARDGDSVEVLSGLQAGDRLVANPAGRELGGKRVEVQ